MVKKYKCINEFVVDAYDENENSIENEIFVVKVDTVWELQEYSYMSDVRLVDVDGRWLEIAQEHLGADFVEVNC